MSIHTKRVYEEAECTDGFRVLVDRLWPRGVARTHAKIDLWVKKAAPSPELRKWFAHDPKKWGEFRHRYFAELDARPDDLKELMDAAYHCTVTLLYAAKDSAHNHALALKSYLDEKISAEHPEP